MLAIRGCMVLFALLFAGAASAATIELIWSSTGTDTVSAGAGPETLEILVTPDASGISFIGFGRQESR